MLSNINLNEYERRENDYELRSRLRLLIEEFGYKVVKDMVLSIGWDEDFKPKTERQYLVLGLSTRVAGMLWRGEIETIEQCVALAKIGQVNGTSIHIPNWHVRQYGVKCHKELIEKLIAHGFLTLDELPEATRKLVCPIT